MFSLNASVTPEIFQILLICLGANLDVPVAAASKYKLLRHGNIFFNIFCITAVSTAVTAVCTILGNTLSAFFHADAASAAAGMIFILLSLHALTDEFSHSEKRRLQPAGKIFLLSLTLAANNAGLGIAAGVAGLNSLLISGFTFAFTALASCVGIFCAKKLLRYFSGRSLNVISNLILCVIGVYELLDGLISWLF